MHALHKPKNKPMKRRNNLMAGFTAALILTFSTLPGGANDQVPGPEGLVGFSGQVRGIVVKKSEKYDIQFKVGRVIRTWEGNKAEKPERLVGRTVPVGPRWVKNERGKWNPMERQMNFLKSLKPGEELTLEITHAEREHFAILELDGEQRERAAQGGREEGGEKDERDAEIAELRREIERLKAENRELRKDR